MKLVSCCIIFAGNGYLRGDMKGFKNLKVLVIEDTEDVFNFHKRWLTYSGAEFYGSMTGRGGIDLLRENKDIQIVILDMVLPDIDGSVVYGELRKIVPEIPVIVCSGYHDKISAMENESGVRVLYKPFLLPALQELIISMCSPGEGK
jgi:DNA-binding NtrC family response regulator